MANGNSRPPPFPPGTHLSEHYSIEGLVRLAEGRMYYLANDDRPDRPRRFCWECGNDETPRNRAACVNCGASLAPRRFLVSVRWDREGFEPYARFFEKHFDHPGIIAPVDMFFQDGVLCSVTPWSGESLMIDEGSPLLIKRVLDMAQRAAGMLAFLHVQGISLGSLTRANFLVRNSREFLLFDPDVASVYDAPVPEINRKVEIAQLGGILRRYTPVHATRLMNFFVSTEEGAFTNPLAFGRALEDIIDQGEDRLSQKRNHVGAMTDVGLCRVLNEDNWGWTRLSDHVFLYAVADGMGGHECGEVASQMAVETLCRVAHERVGATPQLTAEALENILDEAFQTANNTIKEHSEQMGNDMGTTLVTAMVLENRSALVANVGDSRGYLMRRGTLHQITRDHSLVARMVEQHRITPEEARNHPHSNILLRTVGTERNVEIDIFRVELEGGDRILLCSDGLWGEVEDDEIEALLNRYEDPRVLCRELIRAAHQGGGRDNVTVVIVQIPEEAEA